MSRAEITGFCVRWSGDPLIVQAAGGNVSWKDGAALWIKGSGMWLADAARKDIFVAVDLPALQHSFANGDFDAKPRALAEGGLRPSIETVLHALMPQRLVVHLHLVEALARLVRVDGGGAMEALRAQGLACVEVSYHKPGAMLARAVSNALTTAGGADVVLLRNHGIVVGGDSAERVAEIVDRIRSTIACPILTTIESRPVPPAHGALIPVPDDALHALATDPRLFGRLQSNWALYPDHVVFLGPHACTAESIGDYRGRKNAPELEFVRGAGVYMDQRITAAKLAQLRCYFDVMVRQPANATLASLSAEQVADLLDWDAEHYRQSVHQVVLRGPANPSFDVLPDSATP